MSDSTSIIPESTARRGRKPKTSRLGVELLEDRITPDATIQFSGNILTITGTDFRDVVAITAPRADRVFVKVTTGPTVVQRTIVGINSDSRIVVYGNSGNDLIDNRTSVRMRAFGSDGNDTIYGGNGDDEIRGNVGNDLIYGRGGNDLLTGNEGTDHIYGGSGHDEIHGDNGTRADYNNGSQTSTGVRDFLYGGPGVDAIFGNGGADFIYGGTGSDWLDGQGGNDYVDGQDGHDSIFGGTEDDRLLGGAGDDLIGGEKGNDSIFGQAGNDELDGGEGNDTIHGNTGNDEIRGGLDNDVLYGDQGADTLDGSSGDDRLYGGIASDRLDRNDELFGGSGNDFLAGFAGDDHLEGGDGNDTLIGHAGNDYLVGNSGADRLFGLAGNDTLYGRNDNDELDGGAGDDKLFGESGNDSLQGGAGNDALDGGDGNDTLYGDEATDRFGGNDVLLGGVGADYLYGYAGNDRLEGGPGPDTLRGHAGNDYLLDDADGANSLDGGIGTNRIEYYFLPGDLHAAVNAAQKNLRLAGTDRKYPQSGFNLLTTGTWLTQTQSVSGGFKYTYSTTGNVYIDLNGDRQIDTVNDLLVRSGMTLYSRTSPSLEASVIDPQSMSFSLLPAPLTNFLESIKDSTGLEIGLPNISVGMASGYTLRQGDDSLPLRDSQPYLFFTVASGLTLKFGNIELTSNTANSYLPQGSFSLVVDPTDVFVYAKATGGGVGVGVGYSQNGRIPFRPAATLDNWKGAIYGHIQLDLAGIPLPSGFSVDGTVLLDLDANDDGRTALNMSQSLGAVAPEGNFWNHIGDALDDISVGINGKLFFGDFEKQFKAGTFLNKLFKELDTTVELARGSVVLDGRLDQIHFKGQKSNPFEGTPLASLDFLDQQMSVSGSVVSLKHDPQLQIDFRSSTALPGSVQNIGLSLNNRGATFRGETNVLGQSLYVFGSINTNGVITLNGKLQVGGNAINNSAGTVGAGLYFDVHAQASLSALTFTASTHLTAWVNALSYDGSGRPSGFAGSLSLDSRIDLGLTGGTFSFDARADFTLYIIGAAFHAEASLTIMVGPNSFEFDILGQHVEIDW